MTDEARHSKQTIDNGIHTAISYEYADAGTRLAATGFDAGDRNKLARDLDTNDIFILLDPLAPTWDQVNGGGGGGETNTATNVGSGADVFRDKTGVTLNMRGVEGTNDISSVVNADNVEVSGAALLPLSGSRAMTGDLNLSSNDVVNVSSIIAPGGDSLGWPQVDGDDGYVITTDGAGNLALEPIPPQDARSELALQFVIQEDIGNFQEWFYAYRGYGSVQNAGARSGAGSGIANAGACSPIVVPGNGIIFAAIVVLKGAGTNQNSVVYPVELQTQIESVGFSGVSTIGNANFSISNSYPVAQHSASSPTDFSQRIDLNVPVSEGQLLALKWLNGSGPSEVAYIKNLFVTLFMRENV